jgi:hypothetical protein
LVNFFLKQVQTNCHLIFCQKTIWVLNKENKYLSTKNVSNRIIFSQRNKLMIKSRLKEIFIFNIYRIFVETICERKEKKKQVLFITLATYVVLWACQLLPW